MSTERHLLRTAARLWGVQTGYLNVDDEFIEAPRETLQGLLEKLSGEKADSVEALNRLISMARERHFGRRLDPVQVIWVEDEPAIFACIPDTWREGAVSYQITLEDGRLVNGSFEGANALRHFDFGGEKLARVRIPLDRLPIGYHKFAFPDDRAGCFIFVAPKQVKTPAAGQRSWGLFAPLYGMRSQRDWGIGDLHEMERVQEKIHAEGGTFFGTLPLLASVSDSPEDVPSPYSPVSRLFWNEIFLDVDALVKASRNSKAAAMLNETSFKAELARLRATSVVDYAAVFALKKKVLNLLSQEFFASNGANDEDYLAFTSRVPMVENYADFRAVETAGEREYHLYVQFMMDAQLRALHERSKAGNSAGLYLDFPVGVNRGGFDADEFGSSFIPHVSAGAPPDAFFSGGQSWGFSPLHPLHLREDGYAYFIQCVRHHMRYASVLRLDHIMGFHRIYAIPDGVDAKKGSYIRYRSQEFYALLMIEAERAGVRIVGEDLGTVPASVRTALEVHDCLRMWVLPFEAGGSPASAVRKAPAPSLACLNTHDMVPFKGHCENRDLELFEQLKVLDPAQGAGLKEERAITLQTWEAELKTHEEHALLERLLRLVATGPSELFLVTLEDLWDETEPQNVPGTWKEYPNWRRKLKQSFETWSANPKITELLRTLTSLRRQTLTMSSEKEEVNHAVSKSNSAQHAEKKSGGVGPEKRPEKPVANAN